MIKTQTTTVEIVIMSGIVNNPILENMLTQTSNKYSIIKVSD